MSSTEPRASHGVNGSPAGDPTGVPPYDPLRLCIFATIALLGWLGGPWVLAVFAALGFAGYWRARRGGLLTSKCFLRDTRLVLTYLALLLVAAGYGIWRVLISLGGTP